MKLKTVRVRRSRPSALSLALALMLTMLFVYFASLPAAPAPESNPAASSAAGSAELRMEGLEACFACEARCDTLLEARVQAARCAENGGAGLILPEDGRYAVVRGAAGPGEESLIRLSAAALTLKLSGPAAEIAAVSDSAAFLYSQATETAALARSLETGATDASSAAALLNVYRTRAQQLGAALAAVSPGHPVTDRLSAAMSAARSRLEAAAASPGPGQMKLIHAAACADWISMLNDFTAETA